MGMFVAVARLLVAIYFNPRYTKPVNKHRGAPAMRTRFLAATAACLGLFALLDVSFAADPPATQRTTDRAKTTNRDTTDRSKIDKKTEGDAIRVSQLRGLTVRNSAGEDLGEIKDLMLDMGEHGRIRYAALSFGGFLGLGDKMFAIPYRSLKLQHDADKDNNFVVFDVSEETLKNAPGFDDDHWPDMADRKWMESADKRHKVDVHAGNTDVHVRAEGREDAGNAKSTRKDKEQNWRLHRASEAIGMKVRNGNGDKLGKVEDIVIAMNSGNIRYVAMSFGGFLGIGDKFFAVPFDAVMLQYDADDNDYFVMFDTTEEQLDKAPGFDKDHWPDFANEKWAQDVQEYYKAHRTEAKATKRTRVK
jgi:sporulation protein YlmC with PRC-barrel domain